jgi:hypothetical protein
MDTEKALFETWVRTYLQDTPDFIGAVGYLGWYYFGEEVEDMWRAWQARAAMTMKENHG